MNPVEQVEAAVVALRSSVSDSHRCTAAGMRKAVLVAAVRALLPPGTTWPDAHIAARLEDGKTVLMLVARVPDPQLVVKLIDFVCSHADNFWARDSHGRHVIMDACHHGVDPSVLLRLLKWARRRSVKVIVPMSRRDVNGLDAVELAIQGGHGALASRLLEQHGPNSHDDLLCTHSPLQVLELAIESRNEQCAVEVLANKRVVGHLQPGSAKRLNLYMRWEQRRAAVKRLFNIFTCVETAIRCEMPGIVQRLYKLNQTETRQAAWYALHKLKLQALGGQELLQVPPVVCRMARRYLLDKAWPEIGAIILLRHGELLAKKKPTLRERLRRWWRRGHRNGEAIAGNPWTSLPTEMVWQILSFLLPSEKLEAKKVAILAEYSE